MTDMPSLPLPDADPKPWYESRGVIGSLAVVVSSAAGLAGVGLDPAALTEVALQAVSLVGGLLSLWGRVKAAQPIAARLLPRL